MPWFERLNDSRPERVSRGTLVRTTILTRGTSAALLAMVGVAGVLLGSPGMPEDQSTDCRRSIPRSSRWSRSGAGEE
jgi:hypothetical protein